MKLALGINVCGTREIINLAREMEGLKVSEFASLADETTWDSGDFLLNGVAVPEWQFEK